MRAILQEIPQPPVTEISLKIIYLKFCSNLPGANELNLVMHTCISELGQYNSLSAKKVTSHYLNQCWPNSVKHIYALLVMPYGIMGCRMASRDLVNTSSVDDLLPDGVNSLAPGRFKLILYVLHVNFSHWWLMYILWNCHQMNVTGSNWWWVNIGSGSGLGPSSNKSLPEVMLTQIYVAKWRH